MADFIVYEGTLIDWMTTATWRIQYDQFREYRAALSRQPFSWDIKFTPNADNVYYFRVQRSVPFIFDIDEFLVIEYVDESGETQIKENQLIRENTHNDIKFDELKDSNRRPIVSIKISGVRKYTWSQFGIEHNFQKKSFDDIVFNDEKNEKALYASTKLMRHWLPNFLPGEYQHDGSTVKFSNVMTLVGPSLKKMALKSLVNIWKKYEMEAPAVAMVCADTILERFKTKPWERKAIELMEVMELADRLEHEELMINCLTCIADEPSKYYDLLESLTFKISNKLNCNLVLALCKKTSFNLQYNEPEYELPVYDEDHLDVKILLVGNRKFVVQPYYLACWSQFFDMMFYGEFVEKERKEIPLEGVDPEEFEVLLKLIMSKRKKLITDHTVEFLLKLADRFDMPTVTGMCGGYLCTLENAATLSLLDRLSIADRNRHVVLMVYCLQEINGMESQEKEALAKELRSLHPPLSSSTYGNLLVALTDSQHNSSSYGFHFKDRSRQKLTVNVEQ